MLFCVVPLGFPKTIPCAFLADKASFVEVLIKQVEIEQENVIVIFRVSPYLPGSPPENHGSCLLEDCRRGRSPQIRDGFVHKKRPLSFNLIYAIK